MNIFYNNIKVFNDIENPSEKADFFIQNDYLLLKDVLTEDIKIYLKDRILFNKPHDDPSNEINDKRQFYRQHNDLGDEPNTFMSKLLPFYEFVLNKKLSPFLGFAMKYNSNSELIPHYDNYNMPISSTICYYNEDKIDYPIYIDKSYFNNPHPFRLTVDDVDGIPMQNKIKIDLNEGDIVIFRGRNHLHWRDKKFIKDYRAILLHTEDYTYNNKLISYIFSAENNCIKADINNIKNIGTYAVTDIDSYEQFRIDYAMHFTSDSTI
jgi:hypothetical protein